VEDKKQLDKILVIKDKLPDLKAIVQYHGKPEAEGVISVRNKCNMKFTKSPYALILQMTEVFHSQYQL